MEHTVGSNIGNYRERTVSGKKLGAIIITPYSAIFITIQGMRLVK
jgi:hypothetical protein